MQDTFIRRIALVDADGRAVPKFRVKRRSNVGSPLPHSPSPVVVSDNPYLRLSKFELDIIQCMAKGFSIPATCRHLKASRTRVDRWVKRIKAAGVTLPDWRANKAQRADKLKYAHDAAKFNAEVHALEVAVCEEGAARFDTILASLSLQPPLPAPPTPSPIPQPPTLPPELLDDVLLRALAEGVSPAQLSRILNVTREALRVRCQCVLHAGIEIPNWRECRRSQP